MCSAPRCCPRWQRCRPFDGCCLSSKQRMHAPVRTFGSTKKVCDTPSSNTREGNKETPSSGCCSVWASTTRWRRSNSSWRGRNPSSRSWTTCTFCAHPNGLVCCTICSKQRCENERASSCSRARHARGIAQESAPLTWRISDQMFGTPKGSRSSGPQLGTRSFCQLLSSSGWSKSKNCGTPTLRCWTCNAHCAAVLPPLCADSAPQSVIEVRVRA